MSATATATHTAPPTLWVGDSPSTTPTAAWPTTTALPVAGSIELASSLTFTGQSAASFSDARTISDLSTGIAKTIVQNAKLENVASGDAVAVKVNLITDVATGLVVYRAGFAPRSLRQRRLGSAAVKVDFSVVLPPAIVTANTGAVESVSSLILPSGSANSAFSAAAISRVAEAASTSGNKNLQGSMQALAGATSASLFVPPQVTVPLSTFGGTVGFLLLVIISLSVYVAYAPQVMTRRGRIAPSPSDDINKKTENVADLVPSAASQRVPKNEPALESTMSRAANVEIDKHIQSEQQAAKQVHTLPQSNLLVPLPDDAHLPGQVYRSGTVTNASHSDATGQLAGVDSTSTAMKAKNKIDSSVLINSTVSDAEARASTAAAEAANLRAELAAARESVHLRAELAAVREAALLRAEIAAVRAKVSADSHPANAAIVVEAAADASIVAAFSGQSASSSSSSLLSKPRNIFLPPSMTISVSDDVHLPGQVVRSRDEEDGSTEESRAHVVTAVANAARSRAELTTIRSSSNTEKESVPYVVEEDEYVNTAVDTAATSAFSASASAAAASMSSAASTAAAATAAAHMSELEEVLRQARTASAALQAAAAASEQQLAQARAQAAAAAADMAEAQRLKQEAAAEMVAAGEAAVRSAAAAAAARAEAAVAAAGATEAAATAAAASANAVAAASATSAPQEKPVVNVLASVSAAIAVNDAPVDARASADSTDAQTISPTAAAENATRSSILLAEGQAKRDNGQPAAIAPAPAESEELRTRAAGPSLVRARSAARVRTAVPGSRSDRIVEQPPRRTQLDAAAATAATRANAAAAEERTAAAAAAAAVRAAAAAAAAEERAAAAAAAAEIATATAEERAKTEREALEAALKREAAALARRQASEEAESEAQRERLAQVEADRERLQRTAQFVTNMKSKLRYEKKIFQS